MKDVSDRKRLSFLLKANQALTASREAKDDIEGAFAAELRKPASEFKPLVVVGPSGAGKGTLISRLTARYPGKFSFSVSYTTRAARPGEVHGTHYYFVDHDTFKGKIERDEFIEYCQVHTNFYGTEKAQIREFSLAKTIPLLDIDIQGAKKVFAAFPETNFIFICPPSVADLKSRLENRGTDSEAQLQVRLKNSVGEIKECIESTHMIQYRVVNDDLERSSADFLGLIEALYAKELALE